MQSVSIWLIVISIIEALLIFELCIFTQREKGESRLLMAVSLLQFMLSFLIFLSSISQYDEMQALSHAFLLLTFSSELMLILIFAFRYTDFKYMRQAVMAVVSIHFLAIIFSVLLLDPKMAFLRGLFLSGDALADQWRHIAIFSFFLIYYCIFQVSCLMLILLFYIWKNRDEKSTFRRSLLFVLVGLVLEQALYYTKSAKDQKPMGFVACCSVVLLLLYIMIAKHSSYNSLYMAGFTVLQDIKSGILVVDHRNHLVHANDNFKNLYPDFQRKKIGAYVKPEFLNTLRVAEVDKQGRNYDIHIEKLYENEIFIGELFVLRDVTEQKQRIEQLKISAKQQDQLMHQLSHEVRTPMNVIMGLVDVTLKKELEPDVRENLMEMRQFASNLMQMMNTMLDISRINAGFFEIDVSEYHLTSLLQDISLITKLLVKEKKVEFVLDVEKTLPASYVGPADLLVIILMNLVSNSAKYTDEGTICLRVRGNSIDEDTEELYFTVEDTGIGLEPEKKDKLFEEFERSHAAVNKAKGYGVGLSTVMTAIKALDGNIYVDSQKGKGTSFTVRVIQQINGREEIGDITGKIRLMDRAKEEKQISFVCEPTKVLLVDDMEINLSIFHELLLNYGIDARCIASPEGALEVCKEESFALIFLDYMMSGMKGTELLQEIKKFPANEKAAFIAVSADASRGRKEYFAAQGFHDFLAKPIRMDKLETVLKKFCATKPVVMDQNQHVLATNPERLYRIYKKEVMGIIKQIEELVMQGDQEDVRVLVHGIKGASREIGMSALAKQGQQLEDRLKKEDLLVCLPDLQLFIEEVQLTIKSLDLGDEEDEQMDFSVQEGRDGLTEEQRMSLLQKIEAYDYVEAKKQIAELKKTEEISTIHFLEKLEENLDFLEYDMCKEMLQ